MPKFKIRKSEIENITQEKTRVMLEDEMAVKYTNDETELDDNSNLRGMRKLKIKEAFNMLLKKNKNNNTDFATEVKNLPKRNKK